jgi:NACHT domain
MNTKSFLPNSKQWLITSGALALQAIKELGDHVQQNPALASNAAGVALSPVLGPLSIGAGAVISYTINRITAVHEKSSELKAATRELLTNHDIALAQAHAISARLNRYAEQLGDGEMAAERKRLRELADHAERWWLAMVNDPAREELAALRDDEVVNLLTSQFATEDPFEIDLATWQGLLIEADKRVAGTTKLGQGMAAYFANHLHGSFRQDFVEALKTDLQTSGKAFAAVVLRFLATVVSEVRAMAAAQADVKSDLTTISSLLANLEKAVTTLRSEPGLSSDSLNHLAEAEKRIREDIGVILLGIDELLTGKDEIISLLKEALGRLPPPLPGPHIHTTKLRHSASKLIGRDKELAMLDAAWENPTTHVVVIRGKGGEGKTSLVAEWMAEMAAKNWRGAETVFDWSFYSQGTKDQSSATSTFFLTAALEHFRDPDPGNGHDEDRAARLARLIGERRGVLVLDGLEPLQYPPGPMRGALKDKAMAALLQGLAGRNAGLCIVTTREKVSELDTHYGKCAIDYELEFLPPIDGARLLHHAGATRAGKVQISPEDEELQTASQEVKGHALTLFLIGQFLRLTEDGDIRRRDRMNLADAEKEYQNDATRPYGHAFKAIEAYATWFAAGDSQAQRQLAILRLLGLFDRPASATCLQALRAGPAIPGLTEALAGIRENDWKIAIARLGEIKLVEPNDNGDLDCHPLFREYFATRLLETDPTAFRAGHSRLFDYLCESTPHQPDTLPGLQPLYQAVTHGCLAERQQEACQKVYFDRILRGEQYYSTKKLGAVGPDLGAVAAFFDNTWHRLSPNLNETDKAWLLNEAAFSLRALGRLEEAHEPMRAGMEYRISLMHWREAAISAGNLSQLEITLGLLEDAVRHGRLAICYADESRDKTQRMTKRTTAADALHQLGGANSTDWAEARDFFEQAEAMQTGKKPHIPPLCLLAGFQYCDLLLAPAEREAWLMIRDIPVATEEERQEYRSSLNACAIATHRATQALEISEHSHLLLNIALDRLTLVRASLYRTIFSPISQENATLESETQAALDGFRDAGTSHFLPPALLTAAHARHFLGQPVKTHCLLDEAERISRRGPMPLHLADVHLHRARLFRDHTELAKAAVLIHKHHYGRRFAELADAEEAAKGW